MKDLFADNKTGADFIPEGYKANKLMEDASIKIAEIGSKIANLPQNDSHGYKLDPPGMGAPNHGNRIERLRFNYLKEIADIKAGTEKEVIKLLENSSHGTRHEGYKKLDKFKDPGTNDKKPLKEKIKDEKDISKSQDTATEIIIEKQEQERGNGEAALQQKKEDGNEKKEKPGMPSISTMFTSGLGFAKLREGTKDAINKSEKQREQEIELDK